MTGSTAPRRIIGLAGPPGVGKTPEQARAWVDRVDEANASLVSTTRAQADRVVDLRA